MNSFTRLTKVEVAFLPGLAVDNILLHLVSKSVISDSEEEWEFSLQF